MIDFYARFLNLNEMLHRLDKSRTGMVVYLKTGVNESLDVIGLTAVSKYMVPAKATFTGKGKKTKVKITKTQRKKLNIITGRLARSIANSYSYAQGTGGVNEAIRDVTIQGGAVVGVIGSRVPYAAIHEYGGTIHHNNLFGRGIKATINIPPRPYLRPAIKDALPTVRKIIRKRIVDGLKQNGLGG